MPSPPCPSPAGPRHQPGSGYRRSTRLPGAWHVRLHRLLSPSSYPYSSSPPPWVSNDFNLAIDNLAIDCLNGFSMDLQTASQRRSATRDQLQDQNDHRRNQQQVDEPSERVAAYQTHEPQNQEDHKNCPEHSFPPEAK